MKHLSIYLKTLFTLLIAVAAYVFFCCYYPAHLAYHEQYQLVQLTGDYARQVMCVPGGVADYISQLLMQFYYIPAAGAAIAALLLVALQLLAYAAGRSRSLVAYALSFLPSVMAWCFMCNENNMPGALISIALALAVSYGVGCISRHWARMALGLIAVPAVYFACGPLGAALFVVVTAADGLRRNGSIVVRIGFVAALVVLAVVCPFVAHGLWSYSLSRLSYGVHYFRYVREFPMWAWIVGVSTAIAVVISLFINTSHRKSLDRLVAGGVMIAMCCGVFFGVRSCCDFAKEESIAYDLLVSERRWDDIVERATAKHPTTPMAVQSLNLALAQTGRLADYMFGYYQNGPDGLLSPFVIDFTMPLPTAEAYYHLGLIAAAQCQFFEVQEAIADYQKSGRIYKRLAEINLINGEYEVARKYLKALSHTMRYADWANQTLAMLGDEAAINGHKEYGHLRRIYNTTDNFVSTTDMSTMLAALLNDHHDNRIAYEYLMAYCLLEKNLDDFAGILPMGENMGYKRLPVSYQEAIALLWMMSHKDWTGISPGVTEGVRNKAVKFMRNQQKGASTDAQKTLFGNTYWWYYYYK